ncbi:hypothetical protein Cci01nite_82350 [Catellatospora citrea]|uniref:Uncharacterized protein n=1 Tax=Catellatospora citrea TaxID=53366 RepID=A0A8J3KNK9_9ACTN|nr:hypothetical protein Cci01nite_82350 [Catellatospora citrea]
MTDALGGAHDENSHNMLTLYCLKPSCFRPPRHGEGDGSAVSEPTTAVGTRGEGTHLVVNNDFQFT